MEWVLLWALFGVVSAVVGSNKGRSGFAWFLCGILLGPFGLILSLVVSKNTKAVERQAVRNGELRKCPSCAELIKSEAVKCRFCQADLSAAIAAEMEQRAEKSRAEARALNQSAAESKLMDLIHKTYVKKNWAACREHALALLKEYPDSEYRNFCDERLKEIESNL